ncbi:MAG: hypothetical protein R3A10_13005 [Caldilineaceae bacterium]
MTGELTKFIADIVYSFDLYTDQNVVTGALRTGLCCAGRRVGVGNMVTYTLPVTTTLTQLFGDANATLRNNSLIYQLDLGCAVARYEQGRDERAGLSPAARREKPRQRPSIHFRQRRPWSAGSTRSRTSI